MSEFLNIFADDLTRSAEMAEDTFRTYGKCQIALGHKGQTEVTSHNRKATNLHKDTLTIRRDDKRDRTVAKYHKQVISFLPDEDYNGFFGKRGNAHVWLEETITQYKSLMSRDNPEWFDPED